jgi:hypothetical protein
MSDVLEPGRDGAGFNANDRILNETADRLSRQMEPDIDQLVPRAGDAGVPDLQGVAGRGAADAQPVPAAGAGASAGAGRIGPGRRRA